MCKCKLMYLTFLCLDMTTCTIRRSNKHACVRTCSPWAGSALLLLTDMFAGAWHFAAGVCLARRWQGVKIAIHLVLLFRQKGREITPACPADKKEGERGQQGIKTLLWGGNQLLSKNIHRNKRIWLSNGFAIVTPWMSIVIFQKYSSTSFFGRYLILTLVWSLAFLCVKCRWLSLWDD